MSKAATKSRLAELHRMFTEALIDELKQAGVDAVPLPAADKSVIAKFLKDNEITADADSSDMNELRDAFEDELAAKRAARAAAIMEQVQSNDDLEGVL